MPNEYKYDYIMPCLVHTDTFLHPLGMKVNDPNFGEDRKQHIVDLVRYGIEKRRL